MVEHGKQGDETMRTAIRWAARARAVFTIFSAVAVAVIASILFGFLEGIAEYVRDEGLELGSLAAWCLDHRWLVALGPALVALVCSVLALTVRRGTWLMLSLALILLVAEMAILLGCFVTLLSPLYEPREL